MLGCRVVAVLLLCSSVGCSLVGGGDDVELGRAEIPAACNAAEPYWSFEEGAGPRTRDASNAANDLSLVDSARFSEDVPDALAPASQHSIQLSPQGYLLADQDLAMWLAGDASISYWVKVKSLPPQPDPGRRILFGWKWAVSWGVIWWDGAVGLLTSGDDGANGPQGIELGAWHHVAQSRDSTTGEMRVYLDGQLGTPRPGLVGVASDPFREIGRNFPEVKDGLDALVDDLRLFSRVLSPDEVQALAEGHPSLASPACKP